MWMVEFILMLPLFLPHWLANVACMLGSAIAAKGAASW